MCDGLRHPAKGWTDVRLARELRENATVRGRAGKSGGDGRKRALPVSRRRVNRVRWQNREGRGAGRPRSGQKRSSWDERPAAEVSPLWPRRQECGRIGLASGVLVRMLRGNEADAVRS